MSETIPVRGGGKIAVEEASTDQLEYWRDRIAKGLSEGTSQYPDSDARRLVAIKAELTKRTGEVGSSPSAVVEPPRQQRSIARRTSSEALAGSFGDAQAVTERLAQLSEEAHLVSPATMAPSLPEGCEVAIAMVRISEAYTYPTESGKLGLSKTALDQIAGAAGVTWDATMCRRVDDRRDPRYCAVEVVGYVRAFDGSVRTITGEKEMDLRDGSDQVKGKSDKLVSEMRRHIQSHAFSKAKLRAIRSLGIRTGYTKEELAKPFAVARLMFTGRTHDPELRREFARMQGAAMIAGMGQLYGSPAGQNQAAPAQLRQGRPAPALPPTGTDDDFSEDY